MHSKRRHEGYLMIDNSAGPGLSEAFVRATWPGKATPAVGAGRVYESATITCHHCGAIVILNPARTRARNYCSGCDHYICDACGQRRAASLECVPFKKVLDELQEETFLREQRGDSPIFPTL